MLASLILLSVATICVATPLLPFLGSFIAASISDDSELSFQEGAEAGKIVGWVIAVIAIAFWFAILLGGA